MQDVIIAKIRTDNGVQSRAGINSDYVAELAAMLAVQQVLPPIDVYSDGTETWCADGFHRIAAHESAGRVTIRANVHKGGRDAAAWHSCGANLTHGLRRTNADKRHAVNLAMRMRPELSARAIADHVGVDEQMVRACKLRAGIATPKVVGLDGKTYAPPPPRFKPPPLPPMPAPRTPTPPPSARPTPPTPPAPRAPAEPRLDSVGATIPDHLAPLFDRAPEIATVLGHISSVRGELRRASTAGDPLFAEVNYQQAEAALATAYDTIKATTPHAVCPWCRGVLSDKCRGCGGRGVIGKHRWETTVPREMKGGPV